MHSSLLSPFIKNECCILHSLWNPWVENNKIIEFHWLVCELTIVIPIPLGYTWISIISLKLGSAACSFKIFFISTLNVDWSWLLFCCFEGSVYIRCSDSVFLLFLLILWYVIQCVLNIYTCAPNSSTTLSLLSSLLTKCWDFCFTYRIQFAE